MNNKIYHYIFMCFVLFFCKTTHAQITQKQLIGTWELYQQYWFDLQKDTLRLSKELYEPDFKRGEYKELRELFIIDSVGNCKWLINWVYGHACFRKQTNFHDGFKYIIEYSGMKNKNKKLNFLVSKIDSNSNWYLYNEKIWIQINYKTAANEYLYNGILLTIFKRKNVDVKKFTIFKDFNFPYFFIANFLEKRKIYCEFNNTPY